MIKNINKIIRFFLTNASNLNRTTFFWNAFSAAMNSFQTTLLLIVITRIGNVSDASNFVMAYAIGNLVMHIGKYGVRSFQVTDVNEKYRFNTYLKARYISTAMLILASLLYVSYGRCFLNYSKDKIIIVLLICGLKGIEAFEDVFHGRLQQIGRLDIAGKILGIRLSIFILGFSIMYLLGMKMIICCIINVAVTLFLSLYLNCLIRDYFKLSNSYVSANDDTSRLLIECLPLCICMCLNMYMANAPKYTVDAIVGDEAQTAFNIVFMPVFIIALLGNFVFQPYLKMLGQAWIDKNTRRFWHDIYKLGSVVLLIDLIVIVIAFFIGIPLLELIYRIDLSLYKNDLIVLLIAGGIVAIQNLLIMAVTTVRYQKYIIYGYIFCAVLWLFTDSIVLKKYSLIGISIFYCCMMFLIAIYCLMLIVCATLNARKNSHG